MELRRNEETGIVEALENGKIVGQVITMGDDVKGGDCEAYEQE